MFYVTLIMICVMYGCSDGIVTNYNDSSSCISGFLLLGLLMLGVSMWLFWQLNVSESDVRLPDGSF